MAVSQSRAHLQLSGLFTIARTRGRGFLLALATGAVVALALAAFALAGQSKVRGSGGLSLARLTAHSGVVRHFEYVFALNGIQVYDIDHDNRLVGTIALPNLAVRGVVASPVTHMLDISYGGQGGASGTGSMLAYDLVTGRIVWQRNYQTGADSIAITPDGRTIYLPVGESSNSGTWEVVDAATGRLTGSIEAGSGAHNTIMGLDGKDVYLGGVNYPYLEVASTATHGIVRKIGPLHGPGVRPFTINGAQTLAFTTARSYLGFQVSDIRTGKVLYSVAPPGFTFNAARFGRTPDHGISLSPDERQLYLIDTPNGYVHVFDVSGLPRTPPRDVANIKLAHPPPNDGWLQHSRDGRYVFVGRAGDVIDTRTRKIVAYLPALKDTADFLEIDWSHGHPVAATSRYGVGYVTRPHP
jgi:DNA-binding beta-propeller fold protein YncE